MVPYYGPVGCHIKSETMTSYRENNVAILWTHKRSVCCHTESVSVVMPCTWTLSKLTHRVYYKTTPLTASDGGNYYPLHMGQSEGL